MVRMFRSIDGTFINLWNQVPRQIDASWVRELQVNLHELAPNHIEGTEGQMTEIIVTRHWLRTVIWQMCSSRGLMSSLANEWMLFLSPSCIAKDLQIALEGLSQFAVQARGGGVVSPVMNHSHVYCGLVFSCAFGPIRLV